MARTTRPATPTPPVEGRLRAAAGRALVRAGRQPYAIIDRVRAEHLTYLSPAALRDLWDVVRDAEKRRLPGTIEEAGCALGGSALVLAAAKRPAREMAIYDVFGMIPPPSERDGADVHRRYQTIVSGKSRGLGGKRYYGYRDDLIDRVAATFGDFGYPVEQHGVTLVKGLFQDTIPEEGPLAVAHVDGDWYDSVKVCLDRFGDRLVPGGRIVIDDYMAWSGCRDAVEDYLVANPGRFRRDQRARLHLVKN